MSPTYDPDQPATLPGLAAVGVSVQFIAGFQAIVDNLRLGHYDKAAANMERLAKRVTTTPELDRWCRLWTACEIMAWEEWPAERIDAVYHQLEREERGRCQRQAA